MKKLAMLAVLAAAVTLTLVAPAGATVHEIVGQWCAGKGALEPPGISNFTKPNFARPLVAAGIVSEVPGYAGAGTVLIQFNFDHPAMKVVPTGQIVPLFPGAPIYFTQWTTNDDFPAFRNCPGYVSHTEP